MILKEPASKAVSSSFFILPRWRTEALCNLRSLSFGAPAAIVTSMALIVGFDAVTAGKAEVVSGLLIAGLADNLTDSLSVHIYQESERLAERQAFQTTVANFIVRLSLSLSFILLFLTLPTSIGILSCLLWGFFLLCGLSYFLAKARGVSAFSEIYKHVSVAIVVVMVSKAIGLGIRTVIG